VSRSARRAVQREATERRPDDLGWLAGLLWDDGGPVRARLPGDPDDSGRLEERYAVVPRADRPRFLVPLSSPSAAAASVRRYNRMRRPSTQVAREALALGLRTGVAPVVFRDRLEIRSRPGVSESAGPESVVGLLREVFRRDDVVAAIGVGQPGPNRKPTMQIFTPHGEPLGYVKVGWSEFTKRIVRNEADMLERWGANLPATFRVPRLLYRGAFRDLELSVTAPLPGSARRPRPYDRRPPVGATREVAALGGVTSAPLAEGPILPTLRARIDRTAFVPDLPYRDLVTETLDRLESHAGTTTLPFGTWHGDWVPWNMAWVGDTLHVFDWEHGRSGVPVGFDVVDFGFRVGQNLRSEDVATAIAQAESAAAGALVQLGVSSGDVRLVGNLYLAELATRALEADADGSGVSPLLYPDVFDVLSRRVTRE
jgi:hypothetical protein